MISYILFVDVSPTRALPLKIEYNKKDGLVYFWEETEAKVCTEIKNKHSFKDGKVVDAFF